MKRFLSVVLTITILMTSILGMSGCGAKTDTLSMGEWLEMVNYSFGMQSYSSEEPYFANVDTTNPYFGTVQIAAEWDVVSTDTELDVEGTLLWKDALTTLVNAGGFLSSDATDEEKISYAVENFDSSVREYWMDREIPATDATLLLATAQEKWATVKYTTPIEKVTYAEGVVDCTQEEGKIKDYIVEDGKVVLASMEEGLIETGDVFILPPSEGSLETKAYKATSVVTDGDYTYIEVSDDIDLYDIAEEMYVQETLVPDATNTVIKDGNGNVISVGSGLANRDQTGNVLANRNLLYKNESDENLQLTAAKVSHSFDVEVDGSKFEVGLSYDLNGAFDLTASVKSNNLLGKSGEKAGRSLNGEFEVGITGLEVTQKIDYKWFELKEASLRVDYESSLKTSLAYSSKLVDKVVAPRLSNGNGGFLKNLKNSVLKDTKTKGGSGAKTIKICSVDIYSVGVARACIDVNLQVSVDGSVSISLTEHGAKGVEYKNNKLRTINLCDKDVDAQLKGQIEGTFGIGPALYTVGLKKPIIGAQATIGAGATAELTLHMADSERHLIEESSAPEFTAEDEVRFTNVGIMADVEAIKQVAEAQGATYTTVSSGDVKLHLDTCVDVNVYFILRIGVTDSSYAADLLGGKITTSWEIFGSNNAKILNIHWDNGDLVGITFGSQDNGCTLSYVPFESEEETESITEEYETAESLLQGEHITLGELKTSLEIGDKYYVIVQEIPEGYSNKDLVITVSNRDVLDVDNNGVIVAKKEGSAVITIATKDGKHKAYCAVTVLMEAVEEFEALRINL